MKTVLVFEDENGEWHAHPEDAVDADGMAAICELLRQNCDEVPEKSRRVLAEALISSVALRSGLRDCLNTYEAAAAAVTVPEQEA